jgi:hypothetical protein
VNQELLSIKGTDHALIQLDRVVKGRTPLKYRSEGTAAVGDELVVIGHPMGLPTKIADGAKIRSNNHPHYFVATLDTFGGNSGSAVFNTATGIVEGILVRGETDYKFNRDKMCSEIFVCAEDECRGEDVSRITSIIEVSKRDKVMEAALKGDLKVIEDYLAMKGWVNMYDNARESILMKAAQGQQLAVVKLLAQGSVLVNEKDLTGKTALHHLASIPELMAQGEEIMSILVTGNVDLNVQDELGDSALIKAVKSKNVKMVELLLSYGADVKLVNLEGKDAKKLSKLYLGSKEQRAIRRMIRQALKKKV